jgi:hypothetical protein
MIWLRRVAHSVLLVIGLPLWLIGVLCFTAAAYAAVAGDRLMPGRMFGNCWTFTLPRYVQRGGYLIVRPADGVRFLGVFHIPHVIWAPALPKGMPVEQFVPLVRSNSRWFPWHTLWYEGRARNRERAKRDDLGCPDTEPTSPGALDSDLGRLR